MANKTYFEKGNKYVNASGNPVIEKKGNQLTFTDNFDAGGGYELPIAGANTLGGVKVGDGLSINASGVLSANTYTPPAYSTDEVDTGEKWIDGKAIYSKTVNVTSLLGNSSDNSMDFTLETLISIKGFCAKEGTTIPLPYTASDVSNGVDFYVDTSLNKLHLLCRGNFTSYTSAYVIIQYTKPTPAEPTNNTRKSKKG